MRLTLPRVQHFSAFHSFVNALLYMHVFMYIEPPNKNQDVYTLLGGGGGGGVQEFFLNMPQNISIKSISYADECGTTVFCFLC